VAFSQLLDLSEQLILRKPHRELDHHHSQLEIIGSSAALARALEQARQAAASDADILIEAESGTGKELLARMIHAQSPRGARPFVAVNCAAMPDSLLESELFGHARGAFTGAVAAQAGKFEAARGGTLLLDEIGEMPLSLQPKLLRVLQEREFCRLGETRAVRAEVRVIATTNRNLKTMVDQGSFRADLFYRINVIPLSLPPLRERREDIRELAEHFARMFLPDGRLPDFPESLLAQLERHSWPGNVRELANLVRRRIALPGVTHPLPGDEFMAHDFPRMPVGGATPTAASAIALSPGTSWQTAEKRLLEMTLAATAGNRSRAAEMLGISLRTVRNKIREYQLPSRRDYGYIHD
jgi:transcriptional regulator with GAF, ATPase, and Fis domain